MVAAQHNLKRRGGLGFLLDVVVVGGGGSAVVQQVQHCRGPGRSLHPKRGEFSSMRPNKTAGPISISAAVSFVENLADGSDGVLLEKRRKFMESEGGSSLADRQRCGASDMVSALVRCGTRYYAFRRVGVLEAGFADLVA